MRWQTTVQAGGRKKHFWVHVMPFGSVKAGVILAPRSNAPDCISLRPQRLCKGIFGRLCFLHSLLSGQWGRLSSVQRRSQKQDSPNPDNASDDICH